MKRRSRSGGEPVKTRRRKAGAPKRHNAPKAVRRHSSSTSGHSTDVARLTYELKEALEQQNATSEVLKVISSFSGELKPVFNPAKTSAVRITDAKFEIH